MLSNFHTHTTFCDGKNTAEEMVVSAIEKGFDALGFSGHGYTKDDTSYCMTNTEGYIKEINRLKEKYKKDIQIYLGVEEDLRQLQNREDFDYIIGSNHYFRIGGNYYDVDLSLRQFSNVLNSFSGNILELARNYYEPLCQYIKSRKPDIIGHFDLITKFDEPDYTLLNDEDYKKLAEMYLREALTADCFFEVNTGAISRGYRTTPYPSIDLLHILKKNGGKLVLTSDAHAANTLDCFFEESKKILKDIGFQYTYTLYNNEFVKDYL